MQTPGVSVRRSACDRCRGEKLRCLREGTDTCDRCAKANAQCITSPIYRMRNYSYPDNPRNRQRPDHNSNGLQTLSTNAPIDWPSEKTSTGFNALIMAPSPDPVDAWNSGYLTLGNLVWSYDDIDNPLSTSAAKPTAKSSSPGVPPRDNSWLPYCEEILEASSSEDLICFDPDVQNNEAIGSTYSYTEQLSKVNLKLVSLLKQISRGPPYVTFKTLIDTVCGEAGSPSEPNPLEDILNNTRHYLDVLNLIAIKLPQSSPNSAFDTSSTSAGYASTSASTPLSHDDSMQGSEPSEQQLSNTAVYHTQLDSSVLLVLLTCYIHILRLHVALFWHIQQYVQAISETDHRTIHPLPGLYGFNNFPLQSGNLQGMMIIQLVTNMFERMETLLGLPREFRIGTRENSHNGLIFNAGFSEIARALLLKEDGGRPEEGQGGIGALRKDIKKAKRLLRSHIAP
ncbi:uncharacterized protein TRUGW13939_07725 [Talaromyces rugulosus]|uniref:Zn(2)-C6 fungal-type domain-containing protein n=1 Tax=Talaromyces rugulosus TaxID=121627 RepID=A0A7H8R2I5_TALRU|nr:uncharacterized protein TRUGW13939_07725 [Talaromyces rugulosus]QKX60580.1 hypothetical protein TRUGW13939_07725 [Talaromyces rugulosus]